MKIFFHRLLLLILLCVSALSQAQNKSANQLLKDSERDFQSKNYAEALRKAKEVFDEAVATDDTLLKGESSLLIGKAFQNTGRYQVALEYLFTSLKIYEGNAVKKAEVLTALGDLYIAWGGFKKGLEYYQLADSTTHDSKRKIYLREAMGDTWLLLKQPDKALLHYDQCLEMSAPSDNEVKQRIYKKKGDIYIKMNDYDQALSMEFKQLHLLHRTSRPGDKATILNNIGYLYNYKSDYDRALAFFRKSKETSLQSGDIDSLYITLINIGAIYNRKKNLDSSLLVLNEALSIVKNDPDKAKEATVRNYLAATLLEFKKYAEALDNNMESITLSRQAGDLALLAKCYYIRSRIYEMRGRTRDQKQYFARYQHLRDSLDMAAAMQYERQSKLDSLMRMRESEIQQLLLNKEIDYLTLKHYQLLSGQREKDLILLAQQNTLQKMALNTEVLKKDQANRMWLLTQKELENEKKAREIVSLQKLKSEQELQAHKTATQLNKLSNENLQKQLAIEKQQAELSKSKQARLWIIAGFSAGFVVVFLIFSYYRLQQNAKENELKLANMEIQQRLLRSQMNPHFLFNSLNSIQGFITANDSNRADRFLACYARLMRSILENTSKETVSLFDELNALKSYIELEQMRYDNTFSYSMQVKDLEADMVAIPPMLIQPYVENAIVHGLRHKEEGAHLSITLHAEGRYVICDILDNGIGREASRKINAKKNSSYRSVAMNLTKERLELLNNQENADMEVAIKDLVLPGGESAGTQVTLKILSSEWI